MTGSAERGRGNLPPRQPARIAVREMAGDAVIESGARVERAIIAKLVTVGKRARVGEMSRGEETPGIATVGKHAQIPSGMRIPRGVVIDTDATPEFFLLDVSPSTRGQEKKA